MTTHDVYYPVEGVFSNSPIEGFVAVADPGIKYTHTTTQFFEIDWHATVSTNNASTRVVVAIKKNNSTILSSRMGTFCRNAGELYALSGTCVVELSTNDIIQIVTTSDGDGDLITFEYFTTTINEFFD